MNVAIAGGLGSDLYVVGTRPNFVKMAPVIAALRRASRMAATRSSTPVSTTTA